MGLLKVRPSRGSWAFFVIITVTAVGRQWWGNHQQQIIRTDGPATESARAFATCLFGPNLSWILRDDDLDARPATTAAPVPPLTPEARKAKWEQRIASWLRPHAASGLDHEWPTRCLAPLNELGQRLQSTTKPSPRLRETIATVRRMIERLPAGDGDRRVAAHNELLQMVDNNSLAQQLALLFTDVRELSDGTRDRWSPTPLRSELYPMTAGPEVPRWRSVHPAQEQVVLASPTVYFYRSSWDGRTHRVDFDRHVRNDTEVGAAVLWREGPRGGVLRASTEQGGAVIPMEPATRVVALPDEPGVTRQGADFDWQAATSAAGMAWVTRTGGTVRLRARRWDDGLGWGDAVVLGAPQGYGGAVVSREPLDDTRWRVTTLQPPVVNVVVEQHVVTTTEGAGPVVTPGARHVVEAFPTVLRTLTCGAEAVQYVALLGPTKTVVLRVAGGRIDEARDERTGPWGDEPSLRCDAGRALLVSDTRAVVATFPVVGAPSVDAVGPLPYDRTNRLRELLLVDDGLVAVAANPSALRAWRRPLGSARWEPGGFVAALTLSAEVTRAVRSLRAVSQGRSLAVWIEGDRVTRTTEEVPAAESGGAATQRTTETRAPYRVLMMSEDSGRGFAGL